MRKMNTVLATAVVIWGLIPGVALAAIINVPGDFATIQGAIDAAAVKGDEIIVVPGTYNEVINFNGKAINLRAVNPSSQLPDPFDPALASIIDGTGLNNSVVICNTGEGPGSILEGFTITGGNTPVGGGMFNSGSSPAVTNCTFSGNSATTANSGGGGMFNSSGSNPTITNCIFSGNSASGGGGMLNRFSSSPTITNCTFSGNTAANGGGMFNWTDSNPTVTNCTFSGNSATFGTGGGMFNQIASNPIITSCSFRENSATTGGGMSNNIQNSPTVTNCSFSGNSASTRGGGMVNFSTSNPTVVNCTFSGNSAGSDGGGMYSQGSNPTVTNCSFSGNTATNSGGGIYNWTSSPTVMNCILWGDSPDEILNGSTNSTPTISFSNVQGGLGTGSIDGGGNMSADPLFVDADGLDNIPGTLDDDLRLQPGSPCIDSGINNGVPGDLLDLDADGCVFDRTPFDLDGNPRFMDDPAMTDTGCGAPSIVDMGAYEFAGKPAPQIFIGDTNGNGLINIDDLVDVLNAFGFTGLCSNGDINGNGVVNIDDLVDVLNAFGGCP